MTLLRHILAVLCETSYHGRGIGRRRGSTAWPPCSPDLKPLDLYLCGHLTTLVYAPPVDNEKGLYRTVDACQTIRNYPGISEWMQSSMLRRVKACIELNGGHFEHSL
jgi:hypothetical protein